MEHGAALQLHMDAPPRRAASISTALLPPLALFSALTLALGELFGAPFDAPALLLGAAVVAAGLFPRRVSRVVWALAALGAALAFALPAARGGAMLLANRLYASSEAVNAYAYDYFAASGDGDARAALRAFAVLLGALCCVVCRRRAALVALLLGVASLEAYFGVTPAAWKNILLFAALALLLAYGEGVPTDAAALLAGVAVVTLAVFLLAPRPNAAVEAYSERLRDELGAASLRATQAAPREDEAERARRESRLREETAGAEALREQARREFERRAEDEREISRPRRVDYGRIVLGILLMTALLIVPFAPFLLLNRAKRRAEARRAAFADADNAAAIRAMFAHAMDWLREGGLNTENRPYAQCERAVEALISPDYAARYAEAAEIWQEAAYSRHAMSAVQRQAVRGFLDATEATLYGRANWRARFRMKYIVCLCES